MSAYLTPENFARRDRAARLGAAWDLGPEHVAVAWNLAQKYTSHVLVATTSAEHLRSNANALKIQLSEADCAWLAHGDAALTPTVLRLKAANCHTCSL